MRRIFSLRAMECLARIISNRAQDQEKNFAPFLASFLKSVVFAGLLFLRHGTEDQNQKSILGLARARRQF
ncbi:MAG: hypothetical protein H7A22_11475 [Spirochaetales bacterium]|nr:hypothetical protein [Spirochaetales bacterium]